ncbi:hypothetical protein FRB94_013108 [Tulasnella sp. JGI-2019a]|nr:hypothetical protein FRB94_013108 [Tulasnella sp. JGI-2019a]
MSNLRCNQRIDRDSDTSYESKTEWRNAYTPQEAFAVIGPSARHCFIPRTKVTGDVVTDFGLVNTIENLFGETENYDKVVRILAGNDPRNHTYPPGFHETFSVRHVKAENLPAYDNFFDYEPATPAQRKIVREKMLGKYTEAAATADRLFKCCPSVAGYAYEAFAQRDFSHGMEPITISWSDSDPKEHTNGDDEIKTILEYIQSNVTSHMFNFTFSFVYVVPFPSSGQKLVTPFEDGEWIVSGQTVRVGYTELQIGTRVDELLKKMIEEEADDVVTDTEGWEGIME